MAGTGVAMLQTSCTLSRKMTENEKDECRVHLERSYTIVQTLMQLIRSSLLFNSSTTRDYQSINGLRNSHSSLLQ